MKKTIIDLEKERLAWSLETFDTTPMGSLHKLRSEIGEIEYDVKTGFRNPEEFADALMCLFDIAGRLPTPITPQEIFDAFEKKFEVNKERTWKKNPDNSYSHVKLD